jgi:hypothetical protein
MPHLILYILILLSLPATAGDAVYPTCEQTNKSISSIFNRLDSLRFKDFASRVAYINKQFINKPYLFNALGEGAHGIYDQTPLYRTDVFDCETYVDTVLAIALSGDLPAFKQYMNKIRYKDGKVSFINRNHFTCLEWNGNNQAQGLVKDITTTIHNKDNKPIAEIATACIDKPNWYSNMSIDRIHLQNATSIEKQKLLSHLRKKALKFTKKKSSIPYIPLDALFNTSGDANMQVFNQIPNGAIIEIIRPNWDLHKLIGTNLNVSHLGFVVWEENVPFFVHASTVKLMVSKVPLIEYLSAAQSSPTIEGINIQTILPSNTK